MMCTIGVPMIGGFIGDLEQRFSVNGGKRMRSGDVRIGEFRRHGPGTHRRPAAL
jgi:hypothetical protein